MDSLGGFTDAPGPGFPPQEPCPALWLPSRLGRRPSAPPRRTCSANQQLNCLLRQRQDSKLSELVGNLSLATPPTAKAEAPHSPALEAGAPGPQPRPWPARPSSLEARQCNLLLRGPPLPLQDGGAAEKGHGEGAALQGSPRTRHCSPSASDAASAAA